MKKKPTNKKQDADAPKEAPSPEMEAFENLAKKVLSVPKKELDRREAESKQAKNS